MPTISAQPAEVAPSCTAEQGVVHPIFPVQPEEIDSERAENQVEPEGIIEVEARHLDANIRVRLWDQA
jgi:hypothetical protein